MTQVLYDRLTRRILAAGLFPAHDPADPDTGVAEVADPSPLDQPGTKTLAGDGTIVVTPPVVDPAQADRDARRQQLFAADLAILRNRLATTVVPWEKAAIRMIGRLVGEVYDA